MKTENEMRQRFADKGYKVTIVISTGNVVISSKKGYENAKTFETLQDAYEHYFSEEDAVVNQKTLILDTDIINADLILEAEGYCNGWNCPIWAKIEDDNLTLSLGAPVSGGTSFIDSDGFACPNNVGFIECWNRHWNEDDAEIWAEECDCDPEEFDCSIEMESEADVIADYYRDCITSFYRREIKGKNLQSLNLDERGFGINNDEEYIMFDIAMYAKSEGYDFIELV